MPSADLRADIWCLAGVRPAMWALLMPSANLRADMWSVAGVRPALLLTDAVPASSSLPGLWWWPRECPPCFYLSHRQVQSNWKQLL